MKVVVTGATGFVGRHLVARLMADQHEIVAVTHTRSGRDLFGQGVTCIAGAVEDVESLKTAFESADAVYHLVGIIAETKSKTFTGTVERGTQNVVSACKACNVGRLVYLSAIGTSPDAVSKYHQSKYRAEQAVSESGLEYVIFRSSVIYGPEDGFVSLLTKMIRMSPITPVIGSGRYQLQPIFIDDLTEVMVRGLTSEQAAGRIIDLGGPNKLEYLEILNVVKDVLNKRRLNIHIPTVAIRPLVAVLEMLLRPAPLTRDQLLMMKAGNTGDIATMVELFGVEPVSLAEGLKRYMR